MRALQAQRFTLIAFSVTREKTNAQFMKDGQQRLAPVVFTVAGVKTKKKCQLETSLGEFCSEQPMIVRKTVIAKSTPAIPVAGAKTDTPITEEFSENRRTGY